MLAAVEDLVRGPRLTGNALRTYRFHLAYAVLDAAAGGILLNAPQVAIKSFGALDWQLPLREALAGVGMLASLYLGCLMAARPKMPFVVIPGTLAAVCSLLMASTTGSAPAFLTLFGLGAMFEIVTRPATTSILRLNYPAEQRAHAAGQVRCWSSLSFLFSGLATAGLLQQVATSAGDGTVRHAVQTLMIVAGLFSLGSFLAFRQVRVEESPAGDASSTRADWRSSLLVAVAAIGGNARYRRYLLACFVDGFFQMLYAAMLWSFLSRELEFGYVATFALMHAIPSLMAFLTTGRLGRLLDRSNPWVSWAWIRFAWGLDALLLAATPWYAQLFPPALLLLPLAGRLLRGSVQGAWWIMWWQIGVTHFAPPGEDTSRYAGVMVFLNGATRLAASLAGILAASAGFPSGGLLILGGVGVICAGLYSLIQAGRDRRQNHPETIAEFERQFAISPTPPIASAS